ncbi:MAG: energy transducer TonB [Candidatus Aminicenantales bacterium]
MFETSFFKPQKNFRRKALGAPISLALHIILGLMIIVIPLLRPGELPKVEITNALLAPPPLPTAPPLPPAARKGSKRAARIKPVQAQPNVEASKLIAPLCIPYKIVDEPLVDIVGDPNGVEGGDPNRVIEGIVGPVIDGIWGKFEEPCICVIKPPLLLKQVAPIYPEVAQQARVQGEVVIEAATDLCGRVVSWKLLRSIPLLDQAAIDAVRQWVYEPMIINGRPRGVIFTVAVRFVLAKT